MVNTGLPIGGTCVNVGCVPSKHLLAVAEHGAAASDNPFDAVTYTEEPTVDWTEALDGTDEIVERFRQENYVDVAEHFETDIYEGYGQLIDDTTIEVVDGLDKGTRIAGEKALIATGSSPWAPPIDGLDDVEYYTSETILDERDLPESISIIGGGYIALEWGRSSTALASTSRSFSAPTASSRGWRCSSAERYNEPSVKRVSTS